MIKIRTENNTNMILQFTPLFYLWLNVHHALYVDEMMLVSMDEYPLKNSCPSGENCCGGELGAGEKKVEVK